MQRQFLYLSILAFSIILQAFAQDPVQWTKNIISDEIEAAKKNASADIDLDGDMDIVCTANPEASGAENASQPNVLLYLQNSNGTFTEQIINYRFRTARGLALGDLNGDGYPEAVVGNSHSDSSMVWYINPAGIYTAEWDKTAIGGPAPQNYIVHTVDVDADGNLDIVDGMGDDAVGGTADGDYIRWFENDGNASPSFTKHDIINYPSPSGISSADFDGDGDIDIVGMAWTEISGTAQTDEDVRYWSQGPAGSWTQQQLIRQNYGGNDVVPADVDGDGDQDIVGAGWKVNSIDWWANNGSGVFSSINIIKTGFSRTRTVQAADMDGDGDTDLIACADNDATVAWYENDGSQNFSEHTINTQFTYAYFVTPVDVDGDGDTDIVGTAEQAVESGGSTAGQLAWWENDLAEEQSLALGDPGPENFNGSKLTIDFDAGFSGGDVSVFYNQGANQMRTQIGSGLHHIAQKGFYTIVCDASTYSADIDFVYGGIAEWSAISNENDLRICYWDVDSGSDGAWVILGDSPQVIDAANDKITVSGLSVELSRHSLFSLASVSSDNSLPVALHSFKAQSLTEGVELSWQTGSEVNNLGFEVWRSTEDDSFFVQMASYLSHPVLKGLGTSSFGDSYRFLDKDVQAGAAYVYKLVDVSSFGERTEHPPLRVDYLADDMAKINGLGLPESAQLYPNYPNPFNASTNFEFALPARKDGKASRVDLAVYDINGRLVKRLFSGLLVSGNYIKSWQGRNENGSAAASGTYVLSLKVDEKITSERITLSK